jgi:hypothetical protein
MLSTTSTPFIYVKKLIHLIYIAVPLGIVLDQRCFHLSFLQEMKSPIHFQLPFVENDILLMDKTCQWTHHYNIGDWVIFISPTEPERLLLQRIVGKEGNWIYQPLHKEYRPIPKSHCWVEEFHTSIPDSSSYDSRHFGPISIGLIRGKVISIIWPPKHARWII